MKVSLAELRQVTQILYDHLESEGHLEFDVDVDYYWKIPTEQLYDPTKDPADLTLDQLSDNWEWLSSVRRKETEPIAYQLVWVGAFLRWIGDKIVR